jgi:hypothetical protein
VTRPREKLLLRVLWTVYALSAAAGLALLTEALFVARKPRPLSITLTGAPSSAQLELLPATTSTLADRRFTRRIAVAQAVQGPAKAQNTSLDHLIRLTGILDFGGKKPTLAVIEAAGESKAYKAGDRVGETGVLLREVREYIIVEFEKRQFKVTFTGIQEVPLNAVGKE